MGNDFTVLSINLGKPASLFTGEGTIVTGIFKEPQEGKTRVGPLGLEGDAVMNVKHHGGPDQALYLYSQADYDWWENELGARLTPGKFGENLTLAGPTLSDLKIGDQLQINEVLLELTAPRIPCYTLAAKMGDPSFIKQFAQARRPGAYARVLLTGWVESGDAVRRALTEHNYLTVADLMDLWYAKEKSPEALRNALQAPVASRARESLERWLRG